MVVAESSLLCHVFTAQRSAVSHTLWAVLCGLLVCCLLDVGLCLGGAPSCVCLATEALTAHHDFDSHKLTFVHMRIWTCLCSERLINICVDVFVCCCSSSAAWASTEKPADLPLSQRFSSDFGKKEIYNYISTEWFGDHMLLLLLLKWMKRRAHVNCSDHDHHQSGHQSLSDCT